MTFARLTRGDWVAAGAALALLLVMALDWYSTEIGEQAREDAARTEPRGALAGEAARKIDEDAEIVANKAEKNAWQAEPFADRVVLIALLAAIVLAIAAAWLRAAGKRFEPPWTPSALATGAGVAAAALLAARIVQKPEAEAGAVVKLGAPLGLACVAVLAIAARTAWNAERDGSAWGEERDAPEAAASGDDDAPEAAGRPARLFDLDEPADGAAATATAAPPVASERPAPAASTEEEAAGEDWAPGWDDPAAGPAAEPERRQAERGRRRRF